MRSIKEKKGLTAQLQSHLGAAQGSDAPRRMNDPDERTHGCQGPWKQNQQEELSPPASGDQLSVIHGVSQSVHCQLRNGQMGEYFLVAQESCIITSAPHYWGDKSWVCQCTQLFWNSIMLLESAVIFSAEDCQEYQTLEIEKPSYWLINNKKWK